VPPTPHAFKTTAHLTANIWKTKAAGNPLSHAEGRVLAPVSRRTQRLSAAHRSKRTSRRASGSFDRAMDVASRACRNNLRDRPEKSQLIKNDLPRAAYNLLATPPGMTDAAQIPKHKTQKYKWETASITDLATSIAAVSLERALLSWIEMAVLSPKRTTVLGCELR